MAKNSITDYDNTSGNNTDVQSVDISEGCSPSGINNAIREVMADLADVNDGTVALTSPQMGSLNVTGNVGIGTNLPSNPLHVFKSSAGTIAEFRSDDGTNNPRFSIYGDSSGTHLHHTWSSGASNLIFEVGGSAGSNEKVRIDTSGNVVLNNAAYLQFKDSGGTARDVLAIDAFNGLNINSAGGGSAAPIVFKENGSEVARFDSSGNLLVGTTSTFGGLAGITSASNFVVGSSSQYWKTTNFSSTYYFNFNGSDKATINGSTGAYTALSDRNKKKDFEESTLGLSEVLRLQPTMFRMSSDDASAPLELGFIAQDVADVIPQAYVEQEAPDGAFIGLQDRPIIAVLTKAIQEQQATIQELEARIAALESA